MVGKKEKYLLSAQKLIERGQLDKALVEFAKVVEEDPKDTRTWLRMAELHAKRGANAEASEIYLRTGGLYAEQGFAQKAVAVYKNVLKLSPGTVVAHLKLGAVFKQLGLGSDAIQQFELAATELQRQDKPTEAVAALRQAVELQPDNVVMRVKLAESASHAKLIDEAVREFGKAADQLKAQGRGDESLRVVERLLFHQPDNYIKARELAEAYIAKGSARLALPKLQACLNADPRDPHTLSLLAKALEQLGQVLKAVSVLKEMVRLCDDLGRGSERDAAILRGLTLDPNDVELRALAARHQLRGSAGVAAEQATPPPVAFSANGDSGRGGTFDLSGAVRVPSGTSGRVVAEVRGTADVRSRTPATGVSVGGASGGSPGGPSGGSDVGRILAEAEVFVKYGLLERAADHLGRVFAFAPEQRPAREKLIAVLQRLGRHQEAAEHVEILAQQIARASQAFDDTAVEGSGRSLSLDLEASGSLGLPQTLSASELDDGVRISLDDDDPASNMKTPPPRRMSQPVEPIAAQPESGPTEELTIEDLAMLEDVISGRVQVDDLHAEELHPDDLQPDEELSEGDVVDLGVDDEPGSDIKTPPPSSVSPLSSGPSMGALPLTSLGVDDSERVGRSDRDPLEDTFAGPPVTLAVDLALVPEPAAGVNEFDNEELSAELEQVTFFVEQSLPDEARSILEDLEERFPDHPSVVSKVREMQGLEAQLAGRGSLDVPQQYDGPDEFEQTRQDPRNDQPGAIPVAAADHPVLRSTIIEGPVLKLSATPAPKPVDEVGDPANLTYADLAMAYKEMGLLDAAIGELKLLAQDPKREVFALTNIGECFEEKGSLTEAVIRYKRALNCDDVTQDETTLLYFLLGGAFEKLGDVGEALYFFEKVAKRDPRFRDVTQKIAELKPRMVKRAR